MTVAPASSLAGSICHPWGWAITGSLPDAVAPDPAGPCLDFSEWYGLLAAVLGRYLRAIRPILAGHRGVFLWGLGPLEAATQKLCAWPPRAATLGHVVPDEPGGQRLVWWLPCDWRGRY